MPRRASWKELRTGLIALAGLVIVALGILVFARVGALHGRTFRLYARTQNARGVIRGTEVWLAGQKVGIVKDVEFLPVSVPRRERVLIVMQILEHARSQIRRDSRTDLRAGGTMIGQPVVYISVGTATAADVVTDDTLNAQPQTDYEAKASELAVASRAFPDIIANFKLLGTQLSGVEGTLGSLGLERNGAALAEAGARLTRLNARLAASDGEEGTVSLALREGSAVRERVDVLRARADSVSQLVASTRRSYGRFRKDSTLVKEIADIRDEIDILRSRVDRRGGALALVRGDSTLVQGLAETRRQMQRLLTDLKHRPFRYINP
jgi:ABC-type transporter Mla subunit MlaD